MRHTLLTTALLIVFAAHIAPPRNFTPIPVAHGVRECGGWDQKCLRDCHGDRNCERGCRLTCR